MNAISPVGTKFQPAGETGSQSQKNTKLNYSPWKAGYGSTSGDTLTGRGRALYIKSDSMRLNVSLLAAACLPVLLGACSATNLMSLSVQVPAPVTIPGNARTIAVADRTATTSQSKVTDVVDKIFSLETPKLDSAGAGRSMAGLKDALLKTDRFDEIVMISDHLNTVNPAQFPTPLSWEVVSELCNKNKADLLFALELFDTDSKLTYAVQPVKINTVLGSIPAIEHEASMATLVKSGWRIYDPASKEILDEFAVSNNIIYSGRGINPVAAANAVISRGEAVKAVGYETGKIYATRITPEWIRVSRDYYVKGTDRFIIAKRKAQTGNWDNAAALWQQETTNRKAKIAGRACYNMAIINEINGNLPKAIEWAQTAYENYNNKLALRYVNLLRRRLEGERIIQQQGSVANRQR
jgi:Family of unknown function (DUF6340)